MRMDLWRDDAANKPFSQTDPSASSILKDPPPHFSKRKSRRTTFMPPEFSTINEEEDAEEPNEYSYYDTRNLQASIATKHVGTRVSRFQEPDTQIGRGCLRDSIQG